MKKKNIIFLLILLSCIFLWVVARVHYLSSANTYPTFLPRTITQRTATLTATVPTQTPLSINSDWSSYPASLFQILTIPSGSVITLAISHAGDKVAVGTDTNLIYIMDVHSGELLMTLKGHDDSVTALTFSPEGTQLVSGSSDTSIRLWDVITGTELKVFGQGYVRPGPISSLDISEDGRYILSGSRNYSSGGVLVVNGGRLELWDTQSGWPVDGTGWQLGDIYQVAFLPGSQDLVAVMNNDFRVYKYPHQGEPRIVDLLRGSIIQIAAFSSDRKKLAVSDYGFIDIWDIASGTRINVIPTPEMVMVRRIIFSPDGLYIIGTCDDEIVRIWDAQTGDLFGVLPGSSAGYASAFSTDGSFFATLGENGTIYLWVLK